MQVERVLRQLFEPSSSTRPSFFGTGTFKQYKVNAACVPRDPERTIRSLALRGRFGNREETRCEMENLSLCPHTIVFHTKIDDSMTNTKLMAPLEESPYGGRVKEADVAAFMDSAERCDAACRLTAIVLYMLKAKGESVCYGDKKVTKISFRRVNATLTVNPLLIPDLAYAQTHLGKTDRETPGTPSSYGIYTLDGRHCIGHCVICIELEDGTVMYIDPTHRQLDFFGDACVKKDGVLMRYAVFDESDTLPWTTMEVIDFDFIGSMNELVKTTRRAFFAFGNDVRAKILPRAMSILEKQMDKLDKCYGTDMKGLYQNVMMTYDNSTVQAIPLPLSMESLTLVEKDRIVEIVDAD